MSKYTIREEKANVWTHGVGIPFGLVVTFILIQKALPTNNYWLIFSYITYGFFMTISYITSMMYHLEKNDNPKTLLRKYDHAAIYAHIAASYTPFTLVLLRDQGSWGWILFSAIWATALAGIFLSFRNMENAGKLETACFIIMGWAIIFAFKPLIDVLTARGSMEIFWWLLTGGIFYSLGAIIYLMKRVEFMHAIWHLFVLSGSVCHAYAIWMICK